MMQPGLSSMIDKRKSLGGLLIYLSGPPKPMSSLSAIPAKTSPPTSATSRP
jgi:hypothetical protein